LLEKTWRINPLLQKSQNEPRADEGWLCAMQLIETLYDYNYWANRRLLAIAGSLPASDLLAPAGLSHGSLMDTLVHILFAEWLWLVRTQEGHSPGFQSPVAAFGWEDPRTFGALQARWSQEERAMRAYLAGLSDGDLDQVVRYRTMSGIAHENPLWQLLVHLVNHGTQHRSEAALHLTQLGHSPGDLDFIIYLWKEGAG
jgi:uncharacterized damage-inducible protein DinB